MMATRARRSRRVGGSAEDEQRVQCPLGAGDEHDGSGKGPPQADRTDSDQGAELTMTTSASQCGRSAPPAT